LLSRWNKNDRARSVGFILFEPARRRRKGSPKAIPPSPQRKLNVPRKRAFCFASPPI